MNKRVSISELVPIFEEILDSGGSVSFTPRGTSMLPMLSDGTDTVVLKKPEGKLRKYDLPLYFRKITKKYILHRVVSIEKNGTYTMCGDNQLAREYGVRDEDIVGVVTSFTHNGKTVSVDEFSYKFYCRKIVFKKRIRWHCSYFKRKIINFLKRFK